MSNTELYEEGIFFENSEIYLYWQKTFTELQKVGSPLVKNLSGWVHIIWESTSLLNGISGDWTVSYPSMNSTDKFNSISLNYIGDDESLSAFDRIKLHLYSLLGEPYRRLKKGLDWELEWRIGSVYVHLYLFEMNTTRCTLRIGQVGQVPD